MEEAKKTASEGSASWLSHLSILEQALVQIKNSTQKPISVPSASTNGWAQSVEQDIDRLTDAIYALKIPAWADSEQSERVKRLKRDAQEVYARYLRAAGRTLPG